MMHVGIPSFVLRLLSVLCVGLFVGFVLFLLIVSDFLREARVNAVKRI